MPDVVGREAVEPANALRVGCVKYLNARPLIHGFSGNVVLDHPSSLCQQLAQGSLDVALVSSFEFLQNPSYVMVDDVCVSSDGPVYSVFLAHVGELSEIKEIEVDPTSQTSVNLLRCLLAESGLTPDLVLGAPLSIRDVTPQRARLFIGDQGIRFRTHNAARMRFWDLGDEWKKVAHFPFVYALWLIRPEVPNPKSIGACLRACRDRNLREIDSIIAAEREFSSEFCEQYFRECLSYHFGPEEREGLAMFRRLCEKYEILGPQSVG